MPAGVAGGFFFARINAVLCEGSFVDTQKQTRTELRIATVVMLLITIPLWISGAQYTNFLATTLTAQAVVQVFILWYLRPKKSSVPVDE